jgi:hypothetical protein
MEYVRFTVRFTTFALLVVIVVGYAYLVSTGDLPKPDVASLAQQIAPSIATGGGAAIALALVLCAAVTALAPIVFAARSGDPFTIIISVVMLAVCFFMLAGSRTVIDMMLAAIVYFTSAFLSVVVYSTSRIEAALQGRMGGREVMAGPVPISRPD